MRRRLGNLALLVSTLLVLFASDRALLSWLGLPLWEADPVLRFRHRPGAIGSWGPAFDDKPIRINRLGFHDDEFPTRKPDGELRILVLGDSVVMGHGVLASEAFPNRLEAMLGAANPGGFRSFQVINAGVQGYSTYQYLEVLRRSLAERIRR